MILSGDAPQIVDAVAKKLQLETTATKGNLYPDEKALIIASAESPTVFVGDGLNDAPSLQRASVGIALQGGIEAAMEVADIYIAQQGIEGVKTLLVGAQRVKRVINRNLALSLVYNCIASYVAVTGHATPLTAAIFMPMSSFIVILSSAIPKYFRSRGV